MPASVSPAIVLIALLAAHILVQGAVDLYEAVRGRKSLGRSRMWLLLVGGIAQLMFGLWMIAQPGRARRACRSRRSS